MQLELGTAAGLLLPFDVVGSAAFVLLMEVIAPSLSTLGYLVQRYAAGYCTIVIAVRSSGERCNVMCTISHDKRQKGMAQKVPFHLKKERI